MSVSALTIENTHHRIESLADYLFRGLCPQFSLIYRGEQKYFPMLITKKKKVLVIRVSLAVVRADVKWVLRSLRNHFENSEIRVNNSFDIK